MNPGSLYECCRCGLSFRHPCLSSQELLNLYRSGADLNWANDAAAGRADSKEILEFLKTLRNVSSICDVGCNTGDLLTYLASGLERRNRRWVGIEPSFVATNVAESRGFEVVGATIAEARQKDLHFDVILAVDVFEHIQATLDFVRDFADCLEPGGKGIFVTGALDHPFHRWTGAKSYYVAMPEHVAFMTKRHAAFLAESAGLVLEEYRFIRHGQREAASIRQIFRSVVSLLLCVIPPMSFLEKYSLGPKLNGVRGAGLANIFNLKDHAFVVLAKKQESVGGKIESLRAPTEWHFARKSAIEAW